jgi:nucleotide-binding universal stress UspA family protein
MAITTILVGVDFSGGSDQALERAIAIALQNHATVVLVHAQADDAPIAEVDNAMLQQLGEVSAAVRIEEARLLADRLDEIRGAGLDAEVVSRIGPPGEILAAAAAERKAELIVVGTHGHTGISRFLLGSIAAATVRHAPCDVLVCRGGEARGTFARPLVAHDFSPAASRALMHADDVIVPGAPIEIVHAWQLPTGSWGATLLGQSRFPWNTVRDAVLSSARTQADKILLAHGKMGHPLHVELLQGPPATVVTHAAERGSHDLIVVGTHGHRGFRKLLLGSVADSVLRHAPCSVLLVHGEHAGETTKFKKQG